MINIIIAGGRDYEDWEQARQTWIPCGMIHMRRMGLQFGDGKGGLSIVSGMAKGADMIGVAYAEHMVNPILRYPADWDKYGKSAGLIRNQQMCDIADGLIAFWDGKSSGTKHMITIAKEKGIPVFVVHYRKEWNNENRCVDFFYDLDKFDYDNKEV